MLLVLALFSKFYFQANRINIRIYSKTGALNASICAQQVQSNASDLYYRDTPPRTYQYTTFGNIVELSFNMTLVEIPETSSHTENTAFFPVGDEDHVFGDFDIDGGGSRSPAGSQSPVPHSGLALPPSNPNQCPVRISLIRDRG